MHYTIYKTTNIIDNKHYIGKHQTNNLDDGYLGSGKRLWYAINKHGIESFKKEILHVFETEAEMNAKEAELVTEEFCARPDTYNICEGGKGGFGYVNRTGLNVYPNHKQINTPNLALGRSKIKELLLEPEYRKKYIEAVKKGRQNSVFKFGSQWLGKKHTNEAKIKIGKANSLKQLGSNNSQFGSKWITNGTENKKIKAIDIIPEGWYYGRM